jgi:serine/threonine-protein kinase
MKKCPKCGEVYKDTTTLCPSDGSVLATEGDALVGRTLAGKYHVDELVSQGGMGAVYRGTHILMDKTVALKVLHPTLAADTVIVARFSREARAASRISHPHAMSVTDFGESEDGIVFLVMEFLHGSTLKEVVRNNGPLPLQRVVEIMRQVCGALEAAHAENVVHRDLKSDNIMLLDVAEGDWIKVLDFGIAKIQEPEARDAGLTAPDLIIGTPQYMSPEQCSQSSEIDGRSDIYSLGVILYELLTGHVPFSGESPTAVMIKHLQDEPPDILSERDDLPREVGDVVARALAKKPEDRFQTVRDLRLGLTLAAEQRDPSQDLSAEEAQRNKRFANRIIVPTGTEEFADDDIDDPDDEVTVVNASPAGLGSSQYNASSPPPRKASVAKSWQLAALALVGVIAIGSILFAMIRNKPAADESAAPLIADPNSQPVKPAGPPTGQAERDIAPSSPGNSNVDANLNANTSSTNENQNTELPVGSDNNNANANSNSNSNSPDSINSSGTNSNGNKNNNTGDDNPSPKSTLPKVDVGPPPPPSTPAQDNNL